MGQYGPKNPLKGYTAGFQIAILLSEAHLNQLLKRTMVWIE